VGFSVLFELLKRIIAANHTATMDELDQFFGANIDTHIDRIASPHICVIEDA
jgi:hypothetical protein